MREHFDWSAPRNAQGMVPCVSLVDLGARQLMTEEIGGAADFDGAEISVYRNIRHLSISATKFYGECR